MVFWGTVTENHSFNNKSALRIAKFLNIYHLNPWLSMAKTALLNSPGGKKPRNQLTLKLKYVGPEVKF